MRLRLFRQFVIPVYDGAGNVIETHEHAVSSKNGELMVFGISTQTKSRHVVKRDGSLQDAAVWEQQRNVI